MMVGDYLVRKVGDLEEVVVGGVAREWVLGIGFAAARGVGIGIGYVGEAE